MSTKYRYKQLKHYSEYPYLLKSFLNYCGTIENKAINTIKAYALDLHHFFQYVVYLRDKDKYEDIKSVDVSKLDDDFFTSIEREDILEYLYYLRTTLRSSVQTRSRKLASLKMFFNYICNNEKIIVKNPTANISAPKKAKTLPVYLTENEAIELLKHIDGKHKERDYCIICLFLNSAIRLEELVNIDLNDIRQDDTIKIFGKGSKQRTVYLNESAKEAIQDYLKVRTNTDNPIYDKNALFLSQKGTRITPRRVQQIVDESLKKAGLNGQGYSTHKLRHTSATLMYQNGADVRTLKDVLGHENLSTTQIYTHLNKKQLKEAAELNPLSHFSKGCISTESQQTEKENADRERDK